MPTTTPAVEGWFTDDDEPRLLGTRCPACATVSFPPAASCPNPDCATDQPPERHPLSRRGRIWSYTRNEYDPPPPAVVQAPYVVAAVELPEERMVVLGQVPDDVPFESLRVGTEVELVVEPLVTEEDGTVRTVWKWRPVAAEDGA